MLSTLLDKIYQKLSDRANVEETFSGDNIYRVFEIWCDPITTAVAVPFTKARGTDKVIEYMLRGIQFKDRGSKDFVIQQLRSIIERRDNTAKIMIPTDEVEYVIIPCFKTRNLW